MSDIRKYADNIDLKESIKWILSQIDTSKWYLINTHLITKNSKGKSIFDIKVHEIYNPAFYLLINATSQNIISRRQNDQSKLRPIETSKLITLEQDNQNVIALNIAQYLGSDYFILKNKQDDTKIDKKLMRIIKKYIKINYSVTMRK